MNTDEERNLKVNKILDDLKEDLAPFVEELLEDCAGENGASAESMVSEVTHGRSIGELDCYGYLKLVTRIPGVRGRLNKLAVCHAHEMIVFRNLSESEYPFSDRDLERAQNTFERLCDYIARGPEEEPLPPQLDGSTDLGGAAPGDPLGDPLPVRENGAAAAGQLSRDVFDAGEIMRGEVVGITTHGYMLNLGKTKYYLLHKKNLGVPHLLPGQSGANLYELGEHIGVRVLAVDELGRPDLAPVQIRSQEGVPADDPAAAMRQAAAVDSLVSPCLRIGEVVCGKIKGIYPHGASVSLGAGWSGYLHISNISHEFVRDVSDYVSIGQSVRAKVLRVDSHKRRLDLGLKQMTAQE